MTTFVPAQFPSTLYVVRLYDGFDRKWLDVSEPVSKQEAEKISDEKTKGGAQNTCYADIDYYNIFPANTKMRWRS